MSTLNDRLQRIKEKFLQSAPPDVVAIMDRSTDALRTSGIPNRIPKVGSSLPGFELEDTEGQRVRSSELLVKGPLVLTFYRGVW